MPERIRAVKNMVGLIAARFMVARYLIASLCALTSDMLVFLMLGHLGAPPMIAAFGGYLFGMGIHWIISVRFVFLPDDAENATHAQRIGFVLSSLLGMAMTMGIVGALSSVSTSPAIAKLASIPISFFTIYAVRKYGVFATR